MFDEYVPRKEIKIICLNCEYIRNSCEIKRLSFSIGIKILMKTKKKIFVNFRIFYHKNEMKNGTKK